MTGNEYQKEALRTEPNLQERTKLVRLANGVMGLTGESGECADIVKKHMFQGHVLDDRHLALELGDALWYVALCADAIGYDMETIFEMNVDKLKKRYPTGFSAEKSIHRKNDDI